MRRLITICNNSIIISKIFPSLSSLSSLDDYPDVTSRRKTNFYDFEYSSIVSLTSVVANKV